MKINKIVLIFSSLLFFSVFANAQIENPVKWNYGAKKLSNKTYELQFSALIDPKWHLYSQESGDDLVSTKFKFIANPFLIIDGKVSEKGELKKVYEPNARITLYYYSKQVDFSQKIKIKAIANTLVNGSVTYVVCNDNKCLPAKEFPFSIKLTGK